MPKRSLPAWLTREVNEDLVRKWISRKAAAHVRRDRLRGLEETKVNYTKMIYDAVVASEGRDFYTGEELAWGMIGSYDNVKSAQGRGEYKKEHDLLPTVDHVMTNKQVVKFVICGWRTNDAKGSMSHDELLVFCRMVLDHHERQADH